MITRRRFVATAGTGLLILGARGAGAQEGVFLRADEAPHALFPDASDVTDRTLASTRDLQERIRMLLGRPPTLWESSYRIFTARRRGDLVGFVVVVEEIGKHRPITFAVGIDPDATVHDVAVLAYREAYGGDVRERRFLKQYARKTLADPMVPYRDIRNISGATLSVEATGRAVRKAIAVLKAIGDLR